MSENIGVFLGSRVLKIPVRKVGFLERGIGLMFSSKNAGNLLFEFSKSSRPAITSIFVFYPFLAVWLDDYNRVVDYFVVRPFTLSVRSKTNCKKLIELPINTKNKQLLSVFRRKSGKV